MRRKKIKRKEGRYRKKARKKLVYEAKRVQMKKNQNIFNIKRKSTETDTVGKVKELGTRDTEREMRSRL